MLTSYQISEYAAKKLNITKNHPVYKVCENTNSVNGFQVRTGDGYPNEISVENDGYIISWEKGDPIDLMRSDHAQYIKDMLQDLKSRPVTVMRKQQNGVESFGFAWGCKNPDMACHKCTDGSEIYYNPASFNAKDPKDMELLEAVACIDRREPVCLSFPNDSDDPKDWTA